MSLTKDSTDNKNLNEDAPPSEDIPEKPVEESAEGGEIEHRQIQEEPSQTAEEQPETVEESAEEEKQPPPPETEEQLSRETEGRRKKIGMQGSKLFVGNLSYSVTNEELGELFSNYGEVREVKIIEARGYGFVEMSNPSEAEKAKEALDGSDFGGRTLKIEEARPRRSEGQRPRGRQRRDSRRY